MVRRNSIAEGFVLVSTMHITAGVYVNDAEAELIADIEEWRKEYNHIRPHDALGYRAPAPEVILPATLT